jgi:glucose-6-phosphate 1-dehydrogenase
MNDPQSQATIFIIFGGTGDLNVRKLVPALYNLFLDGWMPQKFAVIGTARSQLSDDQFREKMLEGVNKFSRSGKPDPEKWKQFASNLFYQQCDLTNVDGYTKFRDRITELENVWSLPACVIYYLAVAPAFFPIIAENISKSNLTSDSAHTRIVIEKPFGNDLESARSLNKLLNSIFREDQIYRIDHYLGKETVQNILAFRFANSLFEPLWNRNYIQHVQISVTEELGVGDRGDYYDKAGALRDMVQNHILQLLCLIAMEPPVNFSADEVRNRKVDVLRAMRRFSPDDIRKHAVRGQYSGGWMEGKEVVSYRGEPNVKADSNTETFAAMKFFVDNWRWHGVPFYLRTGKRLHQSSSIISIQFNDVPHFIFPNEAVESWQQNRLIISIQPEMSIRMQFQAKRPGLDMVLNTVNMVFDYNSTYTSYTPEAYETLLLDTISGDQTLFMRGDQVEEAWDLLMPILNTWQHKKSNSFPNYNADSWGPELAEALIAQDGFHWISLPLNGKK